MFKSESEDQQILLSHAFLWILLSILVVLGSALMGKLYYQHLIDRRIQDDQYKILSIIQKTRSPPLPTNELAEILHLSCNRPVNLYQFNVKEGEKALKAFPLIGKASIQKVRPGSLLIDYETRHPIALLGNLTNTLVDKQGYLFPYYPSFHEDSLPILYINQVYTAKWGDSLKDVETFKLALDVLSYFKQLPQNQLKLKQIDLTEVDSDSYGKRQIVFVLSKINQLEDNFPSTLYLRLNPENYQKNLNHFLRLLNDESKQVFNKHLANQANVIIDLRIPSLAFIKSSH